MINQETLGDTRSNGMVVDKQWTGCTHTEGGRAEETQSWREKPEVEISASKYPPNGGYPVEPAHRTPALKADYLYIRNLNNRK